VAEKSYCYAIRVASKWKKRVLDLLSVKRLGTPLPECPMPAGGGSEGRVRLEPLFPGYLFCGVRQSARYLPILQTPGATRFECTGSKRARVPDAEIAAINSVVDCGPPTGPHQKEVGRRVRIAKGPLAGATGTVASQPGRDRLAVSVRLLHGSVAVEIDRGWATPFRWANEWRTEPGVRMQQFPEQKALVAS